MCEIFAFNSNVSKDISTYMKEFYSHSITQPHGWGLGLMTRTESQIEKEPIPAHESSYLKHRLTRKVEGKNVFGHIRWATVGNMDFINCHPFTGFDKSGRRWTLIHNGTIYDCKALEKYVHLQEGGTDSERIFLYILETINKATDDKGSRLNRLERFELIDQIICTITKGNNKVNIAIFDGATMYAHSNMEGTLFYLEKDGSIMLSTTPLSDEDWQAIKQNTLFAYRDGKEVLIGTNHGNVYIEDEKESKYIYMDFSQL